MHEYGTQLQLIQQNKKKKDAAYQTTNKDHDTKPHYVTNTTDEKVCIYITCSVHCTITLCITGSDHHNNRT